MTRHFIKRLKQNKTTLQLEFQSKGASALSKLVPTKGSTDMASRKTEAQKPNDTPHVTSRSVLQQGTGAALPSINQRHFLAAAKNATLKQRQLWKVFGLTVQPRTNFVTFQNSERTSLVKKHGTTWQEKQDVFLQDLLKSSCGFCDRIRATVRAENPALW